MTPPDENHAALPKESPESGGLDLEELLHLAQAAIDDDDPEQALGYLKRMLDLDPDSGIGLYLLGAVHAGLGMSERAIAEIGRAVELVPELSIARFQLGMLHAMEDAFEEAVRAWQPLDELGDEDSLFLFKRGIEHFMQDRPAECVADLERGIQLNAQNPALNTDIQRLLDAARTELVAPESGEAASGDAPSRRSALLSAYRVSDE